MEIILVIFLGKLVRAVPFKRVGWGRTTPYIKQDGGGVVRKNEIRLIGWGWGEGWGVVIKCEIEGGGLKNLAVHPTPPHFLIEQPSLVKLTCYGFKTITNVIRGKSLLKF